MAAAFGLAGGIIGAATAKQPSRGIAEIHQHWIEIAQLMNLRQGSENPAIAFATARLIRCERFAAVRAAKTMRADVRPQRHAHFFQAWFGAIEHKPPGSSSFPPARRRYHD